MQSPSCSGTHAIHWSRWFVLMALLFVPFAIAETLPGPIVDTKWLAENLDKVVVLDVRKDVESFKKRPKGAGPVNPCGPGGKKREVNRWLSQATFQVPFWCRGRKSRRNARPMV